MKRVVLVVDDDDDFCTIVQAILQRAGWQVHTFLSPIESLKHVESIAPDVILLDWKMPDMNGLTLLRELRALPSCVGIPIAIISSSIQALKEQGKHMEFNVQALVSKPVMPEELIQLVLTLSQKPMLPGESTP